MEKRYIYNYDELLKEINEQLEVKNKRSREVIIELKTLEYEISVLEKHYSLLNQKRYEDEELQQVLNRNYFNYNI